jgi:hypothetical protein
LEPAESAGGYVFPSTETDLVLSYEPIGAAAMSKKIEVYMEPGYRGRVDIVVTDDKVITRNDVTPSLLQMLLQP